MQRVRTFVFWCHLAVGVTVALVVLLMSATGVLLTYERQIEVWADVRGLDGAPPTDGAERLGPDALLARAAADGTAPTAIRWSSDPDAPVALVYGRDGVRYANAYTGAVLGTGHDALKALFDAVTGWHRWLGRTGDGRRTGRAITGAANLGFLFLVVSGFYLWWPRRWTRKALRNVLWFRRGRSPKARDFNLHHVIGFWSLVPLFVVVASGVVISYPWASDLASALAGDAPGRPATHPVEEEGAGVRPERETLFDAAARHVPEWRTVTLRVPSASDTTLVVTVDRGTGGQPQTQSELTLDRTTGAVVAVAGFDAEPPARRLRSILRFAHTGEVLGLFGQTLAGLVSLGATVLVWTGLALSWRRFRSRQKRRRR